jgi:hypothetical protein
VILTECTAAAGCRDRHRSRCGLACDTRLSVTEPGGVRMARPRRSRRRGVHFESRRRHVVAPARAPRRWANPRQARASSPCRSTRPPNRSAIRRIRCSNRRRRAGRACGSRIRRFRGSGDDLDRAGRSRWASQHFVAYRKLSRFCERNLRRGTGAPRAAASQTARRRGPRHAM